MKFKEFSNPGSKDYDITSSLNYNNSYSSSHNPYSEKLMDLIGILEDITEAELQEQYGISMKEYLNPTADTLRKVEQKLSVYTSGIHR